MNTVKWILLSFPLIIVTILQMNKVLASDWPMFHHDVALSGYTNDSAPQTGQLAWTYQTGGPTESSPAVVGDKVYIGSQDGHLYCLNKYTGQLIWSYSTTGIVQSSPAVESGLVYFLSNNGIFYALNANSGILVWSQNIGSGPWDWSSPALHAGNVFVASSTGTLYSLNAATGTVNWSTPVGGSPDSPISVVNGLVYTGTHNFDNSSATIVAVNEITGVIAWTYDYYLYHGGVVGMVNSNGAAVVDGDNNGQLNAYFGVYNWSGVSNQAVNLDAATGSEIWSSNIYGNSTSTPAVHAGKVFIGSDDGKLYALDVTSGLPVWSYQTDNQVWSAPAVSGDGKVCFGSLDHYVYCLDENTGSLIWSYDTGTSRLISSPAISDGMLFIGNENGKVYAFGARQVDIDIKPGSDPNGVNPKAKGLIPVAILTTTDFDAADVDPSTVTFGPNNATIAHKNAHIEDVDADGDNDLLLHFRTQDTGIACGDTEAELNGQTYGGMYITGTDAIKTSGCK